MIDHGAEAIASIDAGLAWLPGEAGQKAKPEACWRCLRSKTKGNCRPSGLCRDCAAFMSCETDDDPKDEKPGNVYGGVVWGSAWGHALAEAWGDL
jgi:hypothetical protein